MKELLQAIPEQYRGLAYALFGVVGVLLSATAVGFAAAGVASPVALNVALAVYAFLGGPVAATAKANILGKAFAATPCQACEDGS